MPTSSSACPTRASPRRSATRPASGVPVRRGAREEPLRGAHVHLAEPDAPPAGHPPQAQSAQARDSRQAPRRRRRLDRARQHHQEARRAAARRRRRRGPHAHHVAAREVAVLLRHRHRLPRPAHRVVQVGRGDPRAHRRRLARVPVARRRWSRPPARPPSSFCLACFDGEYPVEIPDSVKAGKLALESCS